MNQKQFTRRKIDSPSNKYSLLAIWCEFPSRKTIIEISPAFFGPTNQAGPLSRFSPVSSPPEHVSVVRDGPENSEGSAARDVRPALCWSRPRRRCLHRQCRGQGFQAWVFSYGILQSPGVGFGPVVGLCSARAFISHCWNFHFSSLLSKVWF